MISTRGSNTNKQKSEQAAVVMRKGGRSLHGPKNGQGSGTAETAPKWRPQVEETPAGTAAERTRVVPWDKYGDRGKQKKNKRPVARVQILATGAECPAEGRRAELRTWPDCFPENCAVVPCRFSRSRRRGSCEARRVAISAASRPFCSHPLESRAALIH